ncbi:MAG: D-alanyl-D-alanine carboxypeptidase family protein [Limnochordales bacterium]|nr:D-alanyl-D-alanine carboxypeptidase [Bacillota bacterium]
MRCAFFRSRMRHAAVGLAACLAALLAFSPPAAGQETLPIKSRSAILIEAHSGRVLYEKNAHEPLPPASVTKIFTLVVALEALRDGQVSLDDMVVVSRRAAGMGGTQVYLEVGETMSLEDLLYAIAVESANDAAVAVAEHIAGSEEAFAALMNERSRALGARNTELSNASGLPPADVGMPGRTHVTTAYDIAVVSRYGYTLPMFEQLVSTYGPYRVREGTRDEREFWNRNTLLRFYEGANGIKTGYTREALYCLAASAVRDNLHLIAVVLGAPSIQDRDEDIRTLLNWGFRQYEARAAVDDAAVLARLPVSKGEAATVEIGAARDVFVAVPRGSAAAPAVELLLPAQLLAPVEDGQVVGEAVVQLNGQEVGRVDLVARAAVPRGSTWRLLARTASRLLGSLLPWPVVH